MVLAEQDVDVVVGILEYIIYKNNNFIIAKLDNGITVKGDILDPQIGLKYRFNGTWNRYDRYGDSFKIKSYETILPEKTSAIRLYLIANSKWIGPEISGKLISTFGKDTLKICKNSPETVADKIKGINLKRAQEIQRMLLHNESNEAFQIKLTEYTESTGISKKALSRIIEKYGYKAIEVIESNPYQLIEDIQGIGFLTADKIAGKIGIDRLSPLRIRAIFIHILKEQLLNGHVCYPYSLLKQSAYALVQDTIDSNIERMVQDVFNKLLEDGVLEWKTADNETYIYLWDYYDKEQNVAQYLLKLLEHQTDASKVKLDLDGLMEDQIEAMRKAFSSNVFILTGPPGTGKTFTIDKIIRSVPAGKKVILAAPTGKAAKRIYEQTGRDAMTIHRLLEPDLANNFRFIRNAANPVKADVIILDEASMIDISLMHSFLEAVKPGTHLIVVGDTYQLPAVGPGNILKDMIESGKIPNVELSIIKRQNAGYIIKNCHHIKNGEDIVVNNESSDFYFLNRNYERDIQQTILEFVAERLPKAGYDSLQDIQVISPVNEKTSLSCKELNCLLQNELNKNPKNKNCGFKIGDKVIQTVNDYGREIINGDIGYVRSLDFKAGMIYVNFVNPDRKVCLPLYDNSLRLAYCVTCHKFQGSESPIVIIPVHSTFGGLIMQRNWLYTAVSRAKKICFLVGQREEVPKIIKRNKQQKRFTNLRGFLNGK